MTMLFDVLRDDVKQRLNAWGQWVIQSGRGSLGWGNSPLASMMMRAARTEPGSRVPVLEIECSKTDDAIQSLPKELRRIAVMHWGHSWTIRTIARTERISTTTVQRRIEAVVDGVCAHVRAGYAKQSERRKTA